MATPEQERDYVAQFDKFSNEQIRHELVHGFIQPEFKHALSLYLSKREIESNSAQIDTARRAAEAAERASTAAERAAAAAEQQAREARRANTRATIALAIAIISIIVSVIGMWATYLDAHK
jgi:hypothetical protein